MCFPSCRGLVLCFSFLGLLSLLWTSTEPMILKFGSEKLKLLIPKPHVSVSFSISELDNRKLTDFSRSFERSGYNVTQGDFLPLEKGTCNYCLGSPSIRNPHFAMLFPDELIDSRTTLFHYNGTNLSSCFHIDYDEVLILKMEMPDYLATHSAKIIVHLFDKWRISGRDLLQTVIASKNVPTSDRGDSVIFVISMIPEFLDVIKESIQTSDIQVITIPLPKDIIQTQNYKNHNDRISVTLETIINEQKTYDYFISSIRYSTEIFKIKVSDKDIRKIIRKDASSVSYSNENIKEKISKKNGNSVSENKEIIENIIRSIEIDRNVFKKEQMISLRDFLNINEPIDCIYKRIDCLGENWENHFTVSNSIILPNNNEKSIAVIGVKHDSAHICSLGLFDGVQNSEIKNIFTTLIQTNSTQSYSSFYVYWISTDCKTEYSPCVEIQPNKELFLRERIYDIKTNIGLLPPTLLWINNKK